MYYGMLWFIALSQLLFYLWQTWLIMLSVATLLIVLYIVALVLIAKRYKTCHVLNAYSISPVQSYCQPGSLDLARGSCSRLCPLSSIHRR